MTHMCITQRSLTLPQFIRGLVLIWTAFANYGNAAYTMNETCYWYKEGYIADPSDCQGWGYCSGRQLMGTGKCGSGFKYDASTGTCNYIDKVSCRTSAEEICAGLANPQWIADPNNCNRYCYCSNGTPECANCPQYQVFDEKKIECVWASDSSGCPADSICRLVKNNDFIGDPDKCGNYIRCVDGKGASESCPEGYLYNPAAGACDPDFKCSSSGGGSSSKYPLIDDSNYCQNFVEGDDPIQFIPDQQTCMGYFVCTDKTSPGTWGQCPQGTHFDSTNIQCVTPYTLKCAEDRCENLKVQFVAKPGCTQYQYCENMEAVGEPVDCPPNYPYFDEFRQACVPTLPDYAICQPV